MPRWKLITCLYDTFTKKNEKVQKVSEFKPVTTCVLNEKYILEDSCQIKKPVSHQNLLRKLASLDF